jgi:ATP-binding protein involved in chromosome partitioning
VKLGCRLSFRFGRPIVASAPDSPHAQIYKQIATRIWEKLSGATERKAPRIVQ